MTGRVLYTPFGALVSSRGPGSPMCLEATCDEYRKLITNDEDRPHTKTKGVYYHLGNMLSIPACSDWYRKQGWGGADSNQCIYDELSLTHKHFPGSILYHFYHNFDPETDFPLPNIPRIRESISKFLEESGTEGGLRALGNKDTLVIHVRSGDAGKAEDAMRYQEHVRSVIARGEFKYYLVLMGCHANANSSVVAALPGGMKTVYENFSRDLQAFLSMSDDVSALMSSYDFALCLMSVCKHLQIHKGTFSHLGKLVCQGEVRSWPGYQIVG